MSQRAVASGGSVLLALIEAARPKQWAKNVFLFIPLVTALKLAHPRAFRLAAFFVLRVVAGAVPTDVPTSPWLYLCTILGALFLGLAKRRHELLLLGDDAASHRQILSEYSPEMLEQLITIVTAS